MNILNPKEVFSIGSSAEFQDCALSIFRYQLQHNKIYRNFCEHLDAEAINIKKIENIPFLPVEFFKQHRIISGSDKRGIEFLSSRTTGQVPSVHFVTDPALYEESVSRCFSLFYGNPSGYCILALLPSYLERKDSSLVYMVRHLMNLSGHAENGFYLNNLKELSLKLRTLEEKNQRCILLGVSFALLDFAEKYKMPLQHTIIMETGGMKGRRKEITRAELHELLKESFGVDSIHSEYGMTELLSQAYSKKDGLFESPPWMKILVRDIYDPFNYLEPGKTGGINVIDLANIYSCSFIGTRDLGRILPDGRFEVLGRFDNSDTRGCNLMVG